MTPPSHDETLGRFVPTALRRLPPVARFVHPIRLTLIGILSAGILPCRMLQRRVNRVRLMYAYQAELAGELLVLHAPVGDRQALKDSSRNIGVSPLMWRLSTLAIVAAVVVGLVYLSQHNWSHKAAGRLWFRPLSQDDAWVEAFVALTAAAYLFLILQINQQIAAMQQLAIAINSVFDRLPPIALPRLVFIGRSPLTLLLGVVLAWFGMIWALPMAVAWSAFASFVNDSAYRFRLNLSEQLQAISHSAPVVDARDFCPDAHCRHLIPDGAAFCPRCGAAVATGATA